MTRPCRRSVALALLAAAIALPLQAEPITRRASKQHEGAAGVVTLYLTASKLSVSESLTLAIEVQVPAGYRAELPAFEDFGFSLDFHEQSSRFRPTEIGDVESGLQPDGSMLMRQIFTLEPWLSGDYSIPPLMIAFFKETDSAAADGASAASALAVGPIPTFSVITTAVRIPVAPLAEGRRELADIYRQSDYEQKRLKQRVRRDEDKSEEELRREEAERDRATMALERRELPRWLLWTALAVVLVAVAIWLVGKRRISALLAPRRRPAHEIAYEALVELESKQLPEHGMIKEFYYELSYILREYVGNRFDIHALHQSTEEFLASLLADNPFDEAADQVLRSFSDLADTVKYSLHRPGADVATESLVIARTFVDSTRVTAQEEA
jgi:hypothetical protein